LLSPNTIKVKEIGWQELSAWSSGLMKDIAMSSIAVDPQNSNIIYAGFANIA